MKTAVLSVLFVLVLAAIPSRATLGVDVAYNYPLSSWKCLRNSGYEFAIVRCYQSLGHVDAQCAASVQKAWNAGFKHVDLYMFPCPKCGNATSQVKTLHDYVKAQGFTYGQLWVDIEGSKKIIIIISTPMVSCLFLICLILFFKVSTGLRPPMPTVPSTRSSTVHRRSCSGPSLLGPIPTTTGGARSWATGTAVLHVRSGGLATIMFPTSKPTGRTLVAGPRQL